MRHWTCFLVAIAVATTVAANAQSSPELRKSRDTYHPVMDLLRASRTPVTNEHLEELRELPLEAIWGAAKRLGYDNYCSGLKASRPEARLVGRALTIRYLSRRPDLEEAMRTLAKEGDWPESYHVRAGEEAKPGDVLVVDLGGDITAGVFFGDISALGAQMSGALGAVLYGSSRDLAELRTMEDFPVFAVGFHPNVATQIGVDWNIPIRVGGATVLPGDVVVAEEEAVLFFPPQVAAEVIEQAQRTVEQEEYERCLTRQKKYRFRDVYPLSPELRKKFEAEHKNRKP